MGLAKPIVARSVGLDIPLPGRDMDRNAAVPTPTPTVGDEVVELAADAGMIGMDIGSLGLERLLGDDGCESRRCDKDGETARRFDAF